MLTHLYDDIAAIHSLNDPAAYKAIIKRGYEALDAAFDQVAVEELVFARSALTDRLLCHTWVLAGLHNHSSICLVAVGGYGRGHLQPYSDIDLLILSEKKLDKSSQERVSTLVTFLWDIKLEIGSSVRHLKETIKLAQDDVTIATNLVESRLLIGNDIVFEQMRQRVLSSKVWPSKRFFIAKLKEQQHRHSKFNDTTYNLEPNVKENPGCLRDIQSIGWVAKKHFGEFDGHMLVRHGYFTEEEYQELIACRSSLWRVRCGLHLVAKRGENRLLFDYQPDVAEKLGYGEGKPAVEKMMRELFRVTRRVTELNAMLLQRFKADILDEPMSFTRFLNDDFSLNQGFISPTHDEVFPDPEAIMRFLLVIADNPDVKALSSDTLRQLRNARRQFENDYFVERPVCRELFMQAMRHPNFFNLGWDVMHQYGVLQSYLPAWDLIVGMMQFDLFHAYTVDEHTHRLIKHLQAYKTPSDEFPRCHRIVTNLDKPEILFIAGIFHDIAKGRNGDHSVLGAQDVEAFGRLHNMQQADIELVQWLVKNHLLMSVVAQRRDIYDPEVVNEFAAAIKSHEHLNHLYALTLADIRATNNNLWNGWKSSLLKELYLLTQKALDNGLNCQNTLAERVSDHKLQAIELMRTDGRFDSAAVDAFWRTLTNDYFTRFKPHQIAWQTLAIIANKEHIGQQHILIEANKDEVKAGTEILVYTFDRPALFAQVASVIDSRNLSVKDAQITITEDNFAFDVFTVTDEDGEHLQDFALCELTEAIDRQLNKHERSHSNQRKLSRRHQHLDVPVKVRFYESQRRTTIVEIEALDAPGLLAKIAHLFVDFRLTLKLAKVATIGERAEDVFFVCNEDGLPLSQDEQVRLKRQLIIKLEQPEVNPQI